MPPRHERVMRPPRKLALPTCARPPAGSRRHERPPATSHTTAAASRHQPPKRAERPRVPRCSTGDRCAGSGAGSVGAAPRAAAAPAADGSWNSVRSSRQCHASGHAIGSARALQPPRRGPAVVDNLTTQAHRPGCRSMQRAGVCRLWAWDLHRAVSDD
jgi:hypothetical protein